MKKKICLFSAPLMLVIALFLCLGLFTTPAQAAESDFVIENGVLVQYNGPGGDVVIPNGVTSIGDAAFAGNFIMTRNWVMDRTGMDDTDFIGCINLTSVVIPDSVTSIGESAFSGCINLTNIVIPDSVTDIGYAAFLKCTSLTRVVIPNGLISIGEWAFSECTSLTDIVIPDSVTSIGELTFCGCTSLTDIVIPDSVTSIGDAAFSGCTSLTGVTISNRVTVIGNQVFAGCIGLTNIVVPDSVTSIGDSAFSGCSGLTGIVIPGSVTSIGDYAFLDCASLTSIVIPDSVTKIGGAFWNCTNLTSVIISNSATEIGGFIFKGCASLKHITAPTGSSFTLFGYRPNSETGDIESVESITITGPIVSLGLGFGGDCGYVNLKEVSAPNAKEIDIFYTFRDCTNLKSVSLPNVEKIGSYTFYGCTSLENVSIPNAAEICDYAFWDCTNLKNVFAPCVTKIEGRPFLGCTAPQLIVYGVQGTDFYSYVMSHWATTAYANGVGLGNYVSPQSETITAQSNQICAGLTSDYEKAKAIYAWMAENVAYDYDYYERRKDTVITDPEGVLESKLTVCAGYAKLTQALMQAQGIPTMYITGPADGAKGWELHAWNAAYIREQGRWIYLDSTWGRSRQWVRDDDELHLTTETSFDYFDISPYVLATDHHADPIAQNSFSVLPNRSTVLVNGKKVDFESYNICGNNYFKLRDLAAALNGSEKQFDVTWDNKNKMVNLVSDHAYTAIGGELTPGDGKVKQAQVNGSSACFNGMQFMLPSYNIGGSNYVKLRDIANMLDFGVSWDNENKTVVIDSSTGYTG